MTGDFKADLTDDLEGLLPEQVADIVGWRKFYRDHKVRGGSAGSGSRGGGASLHQTRANLDNPPPTLPLQEYKAVGRLIGRFYDARGQPTPALAEAEAHAAAVGAKRKARVAANAAETAQQQQQQEQEEAGSSSTGQGAYLPCNVKWTRAEGGWVWCPDQGRPRRVMVPALASGGGVSERCGCMVDAAVTEGRRLYEGCDPGADRCQTSPPEPDA